MLVVQDMKKTGEIQGAYIAFNIDNEFTRNFIKYLNEKTIVQESKVVGDQSANLTTIGAIYSRYENADNVFTEIHRIMEEYMQMLEQGIQPEISKDNELNKKIDDMFKHKEVFTQEIQEEREAKVIRSRLSIRQRIANFLSNKSTLRKIPFINRFIAKEQNLLLGTNLAMENANKRSRHDKFMDSISNYGEYTGLYVKDYGEKPEAKTDRQDEFKGKSFEDDL